MSAHPCTDVFCMCNSLPNAELLGITCYLYLGSEQRGCSKASSSFFFNLGLKAGKGNGCFYLSKVSHLRHLSFCCRCHPSHVPPRHDLSRAMGQQLGLNRAASQGERKGVLTWKGMNVLGQGWEAKE